MEIELHVSDTSEEDRRMITEILRILKSEGNNLVNFKKSNQCQLEEIANRVNKILDKMPTRTITEMNNLINAVSIYVATELSLKQTVQRQSKQPWWKRWIEGDIKMLWKEINILVREKKGELRRRGKVEQPEKKCNIRRKGITTLIDELNQCGKMPNRKTPGRDGVQGFWLTKLRITEQLNNLLNGEEELPE